MSEDCIGCPRREAQNAEIERLRAELTALKKAHRALALKCAVLYGRPDVAALLKEAEEYVKAKS
jgi:hypothetical protein